MVKNFRHKGIEKFFITGSINRRHPANARQQARALKAALQSGRHTQVMNIPGWQWHPLKGTLRDHYAVKSTATIDSPSRDGNAGVSVELALVLKRG